MIARKKIGLAGYCAPGNGVSFGFAAASVELPARDWMEIAGTGVFQAVEVNLSELDSLDAVRRNAVFERFGVIHAGGLVSKTLAENIADGSRATVDGFIGETARLLSRLRKAGIAFLSLDLPVRRFLGKEGALPELESLKRILRGLFPHLLANGQTLLLPCRIPALPDEGTPDAFSLFLRDLMLPCVKARLNIYPHETKRDFDPAQLAAQLRFETGSVVFCYDAESGNTLVKAHILPWLEYFAGIGFKGPFFTAPVSYGNRLSPAESGVFAALVEEFRTMRK